MTTKTKQEEPLTFVVESPYPSLRKTVTVRELDTVNVPDAPEDERAEVILLAGSFDQVLNARFREAKGRSGREVRAEFCERTLGDRFLADVHDVPRLLQIEAIATPEQLATDDDLDAKAAELEAQRAEIERERIERREELQRELEAKVERQSAAARAKGATQAAEAVEETEREVEAAASE